MGAKYKTLGLRGSRISGYWAEDEERMALAVKAGKHSSIYPSDFDICCDTKDQEGFRKKLKTFKSKKRFDAVDFAGRMVLIPTK